MICVNDSENRPWEIGVNVLTIGRVRKEVNVNLLELVIPENKLLDRIAGDPVELAWILYLVCQDQAEERGIKDKQFYASVDRDFLDAGLRGLVQGVVNFSPASIRPAYQKAVDAALKLETTQAKRIKEVVDSKDFDAMLDLEINKALSSHLTSPSKPTGDAGSLPDSSDSTLPTSESQQDILSQP